MKPGTFRLVLILVACGAVVLPLPRKASAHCDTMDGPVVRAAKLALDKPDVTPVLKWVKPRYEGEIRTAFQKTLDVRALSAEAKGLADMYFFETLVRLHRAGEGAPYAGIKPAGTAVEPPVAAADKALETGSADPLVRMVTEAVAAGIRERFAHATEKGKHSDDSVEAGREFVAAYVVFVHYVEGLYLAATAPPGAHAEEGHAAAEGAHEP